MAEGLHRITMRLARNPDAGLSEGDDHRGYVLIAPLAASGRLDPALFAREQASCLVRRFEPDREGAEGRLAHRGDNWFFDYDRSASDDDEPVFRLLDHRFLVGEYVTVATDSEPLTYKVTEVREMAG